MQPRTLIRPALRRHLNELGLRRRLRQRPRTQGRILAPAGLFRRPPAAARLYFPFYHDVPPEYAAGLREHLRAFARLGTLVGWDDALDVLAGRRAITGPVFCLSFDDGHPSWPGVVLPVLAELGVPATFFVSTGLVGGPGRLTWDGCRALVAAGHPVGSHTVTHRRLADCPDQVARHEITASKRELEDRLGVAVRDFAAPYGHPAVDFGERDVRLAAEAGYRSFASTLRTPMRPGDPPLHINRQGLHPAWPLRAVRTRIHD